MLPPQRRIPNKISITTEYTYYSHIKKNVLNFIKKLFDETNNLKNIYMIQTDNWYEDGIISLNFIGNKTSYTLALYMG